MDRAEAIKVLERYEPIEWGDDQDAFDMAKEAIQNYQNCVRCEHYYETEDDSGVKSHCKVRGNGSDLIRRQVAVDALKEYCGETWSEWEAAYSCGVEDAISVIKALPSAELTLQTPQAYGKSINPSNAEVVEDYICRADAIEAVHKYFVDAIDKTPHEIDEDGYDVYTDMKAVNELLKHNKNISKAIKALPSAEPEHGEWEHGEWEHGEWEHGEWEHWGSPFSDESEVIDTIVCSVCGARFIEPKDEPKGEYNFCPNCGSMMLTKESPENLSLKAKGEVVSKGGE